MEELAGRLGKTVSLADVLAFPGVIPTQSRTAVRLTRDLPDDIGVLLAQAADQLIENRECEGAATTAAMLGIVDRLEKELADWRTRLDGLRVKASLGKMELRDKERQLAEQLFALRLQKVTGQLENPAKISTVRRDLARVMTVLGEKARVAAS